MHILRLRPLGFLLSTWINLITIWISNHTPSKVWGEVTYQIPNFSTIEVWKWIGNVISNFINGYDYLSLLGLKFSKQAVMAKRKHRRYRSLGLNHLYKWPYFDWIWHLIGLLFVGWVSALWELEFDQCAYACCWNEHQIKVTWLEAAML